ncbi:DMT family transporter [Oryzicola mucosus]|uniref:DMT family transporter n=1 Tax=Oryzicola mucosus TaxID=2767425 RepID=UPI002ED9DAAE
MKHIKAPQLEQPLIGICFKLASVLFFVGMASLIKAAGDIPVGQVVFFRSFFATLPVLVFLWWAGELRYAFKTERPLSHVIRGVVGVSSMMLSFFALLRLPLPEAITLSYAQPLLIVVFSAVFMGEVVRIYRWSAVGIGLFGVLIISWPNLTLFTSGTMESGEALGTVAALSATALTAWAVLLVRSLVHSERSSTIVFYFSITSSVAGLLTIPFGWAPMSFEQVACLVSAGILGGIAQILMTETYRYAEASTVAPFEYSSMIVGIVAGYFLFGDVPTLNMLVGGVIVIGAGIFIVWREQQLGLKNRTAAKRASTP